MRVAAMEIDLKERAQAAKKDTERYFEYQSELPDLVRDDVERWWSAISIYWLRWRQSGRR